MEHLLLYQDDAKKINQFYIKLLKPLPGWRLVSPENWFESLAKEYKKRDFDVDFPVPSTMSTILTIPLPQRLEILRRLCEFHLEQPEHLWDLLRVKDGESEWRIEPIGRDSTNRRYWLFSDGRLYREIEAVVKESGRSNKKSSNKLALDEMNWDIEDESNWELICLSRSDYDEFIEKMALSKNAKDKQFLKMIKDEIIPKVEPILQFQLAQHRKYFRPVASEKNWLLPRKRSSRLVQKEIEEEQRRLEQAEVEREAERERQAIRRALLAEKASIFPPSELPDLENDLVAEREMRAEMRRMKREKEQQIKEIEEAFYSTYNSNEDKSEVHESPENFAEVEIVSEDGNPEPVAIPSSPIKLVLKFAKPQEPVKEEIVDVVDEEEIDLMGPVEVEKAVTESKETVECDTVFDPVEASNLETLVFVAAQSELPMPEYIPAEAFEEKN